MPVILVVYDAGSKAAFWVYVQEYFAGQPRSALARMAATVAVHLPVANRVDPSAMRQFARFRDEVQARTREEVRRRG